MWPLFALSLLAPLGEAPVETAKAPVGDSPKSYLVHGYLDAFWEYPNFLPDDLPHQRALPFQFREKAWSDAYSAPVWGAYRDRPNETVCFRIVGVGYVAPHEATNMWPANKQFIFTRVIQLEQMKSDAECKARMPRMGS